MMRIIAALLLAVGMSVSSTARADLIHPENGAWWTPGVSGSGVQVEIQDNIISLTFFGYDVQGRATFYLLAGVFDTPNFRFVGTLNAFTNGPCIGCPYNPPVAVNLGQGSAQFANRTRGTLTLPTTSGPVTVPIERFSFGFQSTREQNQLGVWFTTIVYPSGLPEGDFVEMQRTGVDNFGPFVAGRLYPNRPIFGEAVQIAGSRVNFIWAIELNSTQDALYAGEITLTGITGGYAVVPRGAPFPTGGAVLAFGARLVGQNSLAQLSLPRGAAPAENLLDELGKRRADLSQGSKAKPWSEAEAKTLSEAAARLRLRLDRDRASRETAQ